MTVIEKMELFSCSPPTTLDSFNLRIYNWRVFSGPRGYHSVLNSNQAVAVTNNFTSTTTVQIRLASYAFTVRRFTYVIIRKFPYASKEPSRDKGRETSDVNVASLSFRPKKP